MSIALSPPTPEPALPPPQSYLTFAAWVKPSPQGLPKQRLDQGPWTLWRNQSLTDVPCWDFEGTAQTADAATFFLSCDPARHKVRREGRS